MKVDIFTSNDIKIYLFPKPPTTSTHAPEVRGENTPERKFASTRYQTQNHQVMNPTRSPSLLSHPGEAGIVWWWMKEVVPYTTRTCMVQKDVRAPCSQGPIRGSYLN